MLSIVRSPLGHSRARPPTSHNLASRPLARAGHSGGHGLVSPPSGQSRTRQLVDDLRGSGRRMRTNPCAIGVAPLGPVRGRPLQCQRALQGSGAPQPGPLAPASGLQCSRVGCSIPMGAAKQWLWPAHDIRPGSRGLGRLAGGLVAFSQRDETQQRSGRLVGARPLHMHRRRHRRRRRLPGRHALPPHGCARSACAARLL